MPWLLNALLVRACAGRLLSRCLYRTEPQPLHGGGQPGAGGSGEGVVVLGKWSPRSLAGSLPPCARAPRYHIFANMANPPILHVDMHRSPLPAPHPSRLPAHFLWCLSQRVVRLPSLDRHFSSPIHLPLMPRFRTLNPPECHRHHALGHLCPSEPTTRQE